MRRTIWVVGRRGFSMAIMSGRSAAIHRLYLRRASDPFCNQHDEPEDCVVLDVAFRCVGRRVVVDYVGNKVIGRSQPDVCFQRGKWEGCRGSLYFLSEDDGDLAAIAESIAASALAEQVRAALSTLPRKNKRATRQLVLS